MNPEGYSTSFSRIQVPTTFKSSTTAKKRSYVRESDAGTPEQFPIKMFNVELLLSSNQAQCKSEVDGSQGGKPSKKEKMEQLQRRVKQSKRNITKAIEGFMNRVTSYMKYPTDDKVEIPTKIDDANGILKAQENVKDRYKKLEDEVEKFQIFLEDYWEQSEDEIETMICRSISELMKYENKVTEMSRDNEVVLERCKALIKSLTQPAPVTKFNHLDSTQKLGKMTKHANLII